VGEAFSFVHFISLIVFRSLSFTSKTSSGTLHHPFSQFPQRAHNHFIGITELGLSYILSFSIATDPSKNVIYFYLQFLNTYEVADSLSKEASNKTKYRTRE
jgi:hypothetical protein